MVLQGARHPHLRVRHLVSPVGAPEEGTLAPDVEVGTSGGYEEVEFCALDRALAHERVPIGNRALRLRRCLELEAVRAVIDSIQPKGGLGDREALAEPVPVLDVQQADAEQGLGRGAVGVSHHVAHGEVVVAVGAVQEED